MRGLFKTLFGDGRILTVVAICLLIPALIVHAGFVSAGGLLLPFLLLAGLRYLSRH
jgi:hypothetical protein